MSDSEKKEGREYCFVCNGLLDLRKRTNFILFRNNGSWWQSSPHLCFHEKCWGEVAGEDYMLGKK